jgi:uncharacterized protein with HEPN domain
MNPEIQVWLQDILEAIEEIESFLPSKKDFNEFKNDLKSKRAIERNIEIIGEAMNRILKNNISLPIQESRKIVDTRNRIIHGYDSVSYEIIWSIVSRDIPQLKMEIRKVLQDK